jgi:hypothetical protein
MSTFAITIPIPAHAAIFADRSYVVLQMMRSAPIPFNLIDSGHYG